MKQTAVEWLENEFQKMCKDFGGLHSDFIVKFDQAKAMEKEQISQAFCCGGDGESEAEIYYNEMFSND